MSTTKVYPLSLTRGYVVSWGLREAVREIIQNALDSDSDFGYAIDGDTLTVISRYASLSPQTLLLGSSNKGGDISSIGQFGEGYKLALLVLTRDGLPVTIHNNTKLWTPSFQHDETFYAEVLVITESEAPQGNQGIEFIVGGLTAQDIDAVRDSCLFMQPGMTDVIPCTYGRILPSRPGKLYVGGLHVCDTKMTYGYDFDPEHLQLERDRKTVDSFKFELLCARAWASTGQNELIARMMEDGEPDVEDMRFTTMPDALKDACAKRYIKKFGDAVPVTSQKEANDKNAAGQKTAYVGSSYSMAVTSSSVYRESRPATPAPLSPREAIEKWFDDHKKHMPRLSKVAFKKLVDQSASWVLKGGAPF